MKRNKYLIKLIISVVLTVVTASFCAATFAIWTALTSNSVLIEMKADDKNPSLKYQLYVPINSSGERLAGVYDFQNKTYTLTDANDAANIDALSFAGWDGGIAVDRLILPDTYPLTVNGTEYTLPVKRVGVYEDFRRYTLRDNQVINYISLPASLVYVASGAFASMSELTELYIYGPGELYIGAYGFAYCTKLQNEVCLDNRELVSDSPEIFDTVFLKG